jgi:hypothetical protein
MLVDRVAREREAAGEIARIHETLANAKRMATMSLASGTADMFGSFANLAQTFGRRGFAMWKGLAIAQATINTFQGATAAFGSAASIPFIGWKIAPIVAGMAVASGLANVATIARTQPPGFAAGGRPEVGRVSVVGERGPELFVADAPGTVIPNHMLGTFGTQGDKFSVAVFDDRSKMREWLQTREGKTAVIDLVGKYRHEFS